MAVPRTHLELGDAAGAGPALAAARGFAPPDPSALKQQLVADLSRQRRRVHWLRRSGERRGCQAAQPGAVRMRAVLDKYGVGVPTDGVVRIEFSVAVDSATRFFPGPRSCPSPELRRNHPLHAERRHRAGNRQRARCPIRLPARHATRTGLEARLQGKGPGQGERERFGRRRYGEYDKKLVQQVPRRAMQACKIAWDAPASQTPEGRAPSRSRES